MDPLVLNPAVAGLKPCFNALLGYRRQWANLERPVNTSLVGIHFSLGRKGVDQFKSGWHGLGFMINEDQNGDFHTTRLSAIYAYHLKLRNNAILSAGSYVTFKRLAVDSEGFRVRDPNDPALDQDQVVFFIPEISPGIWYNDKRVFAGLSVWNATQYRGRFLGRQIGSPMDLSPHVYLMGGYRYTFGGDFYHLLPSAMIRYGRNLPPSVDINMLWSYDYRFNVSLGYRLQDAVMASLQLVIARSWQVGYNYDYTLSRHRYGAQHTHEVVITFSRCLLPGPYINPFWCPAYARNDSN